MPIIIFATSGAHGTHALLPKSKWFSYGSREERLADTVNQRGVSWRKRVFTIITGEGGGKSSSYTPVYPFEEVDSFSALPQVGREGGSMRREVGIYTCYTCTVPDL